MNMSIEALTEKRVITLRDKSYTIVCSPEEWHPSSWSHVDEAETRAEWWRPVAGDVVLDVGADFGSYTLPALAAGAQVFAWSPPFKDAAPVEAYCIELSAWENGFEGLLTTFRDGLWSERGWLAAMDGPRPPRLFATREEAKAAIAGQPGYCSAFPVRTIDAMVTAGLIPDEVDWIKIDTEGCELPVLVGATKVLKTRRARILTENHTHLDPDCERKVDEFLFSLGVGYKKVGTRPHHTISHSLYDAEP